MNEVLRIDTNFNLFEHWLSDSCYGNLRFEINEEKHPIFVGPSNCEISEMYFYQSNTRSLRTVGCD